MRLLILPIAILASLCHGGTPKRSLWKKIDFDPSGTPLWVDSLCYDKHGKLLAEYRKDAQARLQHSIQYHYDDSGRSHKAVKLSPDDRILEEARCGFTGRELSSWTRVADNITMDGISYHNDSAGNRIAYIQVAATAYRFTLDKHGKAGHVALLGGMGGSVQVSAEFGYDSRRRHAATRFFGADGSPIGRDTILRAKSGGMRELRRFDAAGLPVATVVHEHGPGGEVKRKSFRESDGKVTMQREHAFLRADSLDRLNALSSEWNGPAVTGPCDLNWYWNVDLGIEPATLHGLFLPQAKAKDNDKAVDRMPANPNAFRDSLDRVRERETERLKAGQSEWGACQAKPNPLCIQKAYADLGRLRKEKPARWYLGEAIDSSAGLVLELDGDRAYAKLLASATAEKASLSKESVVIRKLLKYRLDKAYSRFCRASASGLADRKRKDTGPRLTQAPKDMPDAFREAWLYRRNILHAGREPAEPPDTAGADKWTEPDLYRHILAFLRKDRPEILDSIRPYQWGGWCGTGSESLYGPKGDALLIADLERGDLHASLSGTSDPERIRQMLICRGMDWESFFLGGILHADGESANQAMRILARYGSADAFRRLLLLEPANGDSYPSGYFEALGTFLVGPGKDVPAVEARWGGMRLSRDARAPELPIDLRKQALDRLTGKIDGNPYKIDAMVFARIFASLDFPNRAHYLKRLAAVPYPESRKIALDALEKMGEEAGPLPPLEPVALIITSHGKPFPYGNISVGFPCPEKDASCSGRLSSSTNSEERYSISREIYLHAWYQAKALRLYNYYSGSENPLDDAIFNATIPLVETPAGPIPVDIPLRKIELELGFPPGFQIKQETKIRVRAQRLEKEADSYFSPFEVSPRKRLSFSRLGDGFYEFGLEIPGLQGWRSGRVEVRGNATHSVALRKGSDLKYRIRSKREGDSAFAVKVDLRHASLGRMKRSAFDPPASDLQSTSGRQDGFRGLPPGRYALELTSMADPAAPKSKPTRKVHEFMISEDSPDMVDLGEIWLDPPEP